MHIPNELREELDSLRIENNELALEEEITINDKFLLRDLMPNYLHITCDKIVLEQNQVEIVFDTHEDISRFKSIIINGIKFIREVK